MAAADERAIPKPAMSKQHDSPTIDLDALPSDARDFIAAELSDGNQLLAVHAPPPGVSASIYVLLARAPRTRADDIEGGWRFGELAPGLPAVLVMVSEPCEEDPPPVPEPPQARPRHRRYPEDSPLVARFRISMALDYDAWHDGTGYDLEAIDAASPAEREAMMQLLIDRGLDDWRDIEAVTRIGGEKADQLLKRLQRQGSARQRLHVLRHAPQQVDDQQRTEALVQALTEGESFGSLSACLDEVEAWHPPPVIEALWRAIERPDDTLAINGAAMLAFLHGLADEPFDWSQRPFFLRFGSDDADERAAARAELRQRIAEAQP
ncbi:hypothetical protein HLB44_18195 [Aquincola sp. S2]|uniref:Uncharacterized protein n=1 Tax=Pseudaquabacterium terrae TaxID=2732868 RepID=A0ABX2EJY6_9BURK|nr:hypothetical protein [Aquabacterium terrae]NRF68928.1 hypothetical protein [Aquabacterium terrae]